MQRCQHTCQSKRLNKKKGRFYFFYLSAPGQKIEPSLGFTVIELLITVSIFAAVGAAIYTTFNSGMRVWRSVKDADIAEARNLIKFEKLSRELRQSLVFEDIAFTGNKENIEFPQVIDSDIARVTYKLDAGRSNLLRFQVKLKDILEEQSPEPSPGNTYLTDIENFNFSYLYFDSEKSSYAWEENWEGPGLPLAVKIDITIGGKNYASTVFIPAA